MCQDGSCFESNCFRWINLWRMVRGGARSGDCTVTQNDNKDVTATFDITEGPGNDLTVRKGNGNVKSDWWHKLHDR